MGTGAQGLGPSSPIFPGYNEGAGWKWSGQNTNKGPLYDANDEGRVLPNYATSSLGPRHLLLCLLLERPGDRKGKRGTEKARICCFTAHDSQSWAGVEPGLEGDA